VAKPKITCVIPARNEESVIGKCLGSLKAQSLKVTLILVNDGSTDNTRKIAEAYTDVVIDLPTHKESRIGTPWIPKILNIGFSEARKTDPDYLMVSGADSYYPSKYVEKLVQRMKKHGDVVASGTFKGERTEFPGVRGSGRIFDAEWFETIGFRYPENYGFEHYPVYRALMEGRSVGVYGDINYILLRPTIMNSRKAFTWGKGMKALGYNPVYVAGRCILYGLKSPKIGVSMFSGYLTKVEKYGDISTFVSAYQARLMFTRVKSLIF